MNKLVYLKKDDAFTDSLVIANGTGVEHRKIKASIKRHHDQLEKFGKLSAPYRAESTGGRPEEYYVLNESQATFLVTLLKNTEVVINFKAELVRQFYKMREILAQKQTIEWQQMRTAGKLTRKAETDTIKELVILAKAQGSSHADMLYMTYSKLANKMAGISKRDQASFSQLNDLNIFEQIILNIIRQGIVANRNYKQIYQDCKERCETAKQIAFIGG